VLTRSDKEPDSMGGELFANISGGIYSSV